MHSLIFVISAIFCVPVISNVVFLTANETVAILGDETLSGSGEEELELILEMTETKTKADLEVEAYFDEANVNATMDFDETLPTLVDILNETGITNECIPCVKCPIENSVSINALCFCIFLTNTLTITVFTLSAVLISYLSQPPDFY